MPFIAFLFSGSPLAKLVGGLLIVAFLAISFLGLKYAYDSSIRKEALLEYNRHQLEIIQQQNEKFANDMKALTATSEELKTKLDNQLKDIDNSLNDIQDSVEAKGIKSGEASPYLKETFRELQKRLPK